MNKKIVVGSLCGLVLTLVPLVSTTTYVVAEETSKTQSASSVVDKALSKEKTEVIAQAERSGMLPSILMALWVRNTQFGLNPSAFSVSDFVTELINSDSELAKRILETGSVDEAVALLFKYGYSSERDFVGSMNSALSMPYIKGLDREVFTKGVKPLYDKEQLKQGQQKRISWVSLNQDADLPLAQLESKADNSLAFERVGEKYLGENRLVNFLLPTKDKHWWEFWKKGLAESSVTFGTETVALTPQMKAYVSVFAKKLGLDLDNASAVKTSNGLIAVGSADKKVLLNKLGRIVAFWSKEAKPHGFEGVQQVIKGAGGYFTIGLRSSSLLEDKPSVEIATNSLEGIDLSVLGLSSSEKAVSAFTIYDVGNRYIIVEDSKTGSYKVLSEFGGQVGSSNKDDIKGGNLEDLAVYTPIKTEVGVLWVQI